MCIVVARTQNHSGHVFINSSTSSCFLQRARESDRPVLRPRAPQGPLVEWKHARRETCNEREGTREKREETETSEIVCMKEIVCKNNFMIDLSSSSSLCLISRLPSVAVLLSWNHAHPSSLSYKGAVWHPWSQDQSAIRMTHATRTRLVSLVSSLGTHARARARESLWCTPAARPEGSRPLQQAGPPRTRT